MSKVTRRKRTQEEWLSYRRKRSGSVIWGYVWRRQTRLCWSRWCWRGVPPRQSASLLADLGVISLSRMRTRLSAIARTSFSRIGPKFKACSWTNSRKVDHVNCRFYFTPEILVTLVLVLCWGECKYFFNGPQKFTRGLVSSLTKLLHSPKEQIVKTSSIYEDFKKGIYSKL